MPHLILDWLQIDVVVESHTSKKDFQVQLFVLLQNNYGLLSLEVLTARAKHAGTYTCEASNEEGTVSCSAKLEIEGRLLPIMDKEKHLIVFC